MIVKYKLLGEYVNPVKREDIYLEINHDQESVINQPKPHVGINNLFFAREDVQRIMGSLDLPPGITEGVPFDIEITERNQTEVINMYLDLMDGFRRSKNGIEVTVKMLQSLDWIDDQTEKFTFESLYNDKSSTPFKIDGITYNSYQDYFDKRCIYIPYVISTIPNFRDAFMALFSITYIVVELTKAVKLLLQWAVPIAGVGVVLAIAQLIAEIIYFALLTAALIALIIHLFDCLIQALKYHGAMLLIDMLKITAHKMGLNFNSSIWDVYPYNQIAYLPEKFNPLDSNVAKNSILGVTFAGFKKKGFTSPGYATFAAHDSSTETIQKGYLNGTGGDLLRLVKRFCNGKIIIPDQTNDLVLERRDYYPSSSHYQLPDIRQDWNGYNTDELFATMIIRFANDLNDKNSIDKYIGTILEAVHSQVLTTDQRLICIKGLREILINASRGIRKTELNFIEEIHEDLYRVFTSITNGGIDLLNAAIDTVNFLIKFVLNPLISVMNLLMNLVIAIAKVVNQIVDAISTLFGGDGVGDPPDWIPLDKNWVDEIKKVSYVSVENNYDSRIDALLLENDMVTTPKLLLVNTSREEFNESGGFSGKKRIAYLHPDNENIINGAYLWEKFYFIDSFVGPNHNRFTKISPSLNSPSESNPFLLTLRDFKNLVSNPKIKDNFEEQVISDSIQWYPEKNGMANIDFRKRGWLKNPESNDGAKRSEELNINLQIKTSLPNGQ